MNEYDKQAKDFCKKCNISIEKHFIGVVDGFPNSDDKLQHYHFLIKVVRLESNGCKSRWGDKDYFTFDFYGSYKDYKDDKIHYKAIGSTKPSDYDILASINLDSCTPDNMGDFIAEFGYEIKCKKDFDRIQNIFNGCNEIRSKVNDFFTEEEIEMLSEIV